MASEPGPKFQSGSSSESSMTDCSEPQDGNTSPLGREFYATENVVEFHTIASDNTQFCDSLEDDHKSYLADVCKLTKKKLQQKHQRQKIPQVPWIDYEWELPFEHYYVSLAVHSEEDDNKGVQTTEMPLQDIFRLGSNKTATRILLEGCTGYGKSTLAMKLCYDYSKGEDYIKDYDFAILLRLREFNDSTLDEMLARKLKLDNRNVQSVVNAIKTNQKSILIILDSCDESDKSTRDNLDPLLKREYLPNATVIVTTRPGLVKRKDIFDKRVEVKGVCDTARCQFLQLHLQYCSELKKSFLIDFLRTNFGLVCDLERNQTVVSKRWSRNLSLVQEEEKLLDCPLFLLLLIAVAKSSYPVITLFTSKIGLYRKLFNFAAQIALSGEQDVEQTADLFRFDSENPPSYAQSLSQFGKLALDNMSIKEVTFRPTSEKILSQCNGDNFVLLMGILIESSYFDYERGHHVYWYQPIHSSILVFCASYHLWYIFKCEPSVFKFPLEFLPDQSGRVESFVFPFFVGLCGDTLPLFFTRLLTAEFPHDAVQRFARCESLITESSEELNILSKSLLPLVPKVWRTSYFGDGAHTATKLLRMTVAEAGWNGLLNCIIHDCDLGCGIPLAKGCAQVPMIVLMSNCTMNSYQQTYGNVTGFEFRIYMESCKNTTDLLTQVSLAKPSVISIVKESSNPYEGVSTSLLFQSHNYNEVFTLCPWTVDELMIVQAKTEGNNVVGEIIGIHTPLVKATLAVKSKWLELKPMKLS